MVGLTNNRSIQDEKLIEAIFQSHHYTESPISRSQAIYGATATNLIIDARPTTNAMVMSVKGAGTENMEYYKDGKKAYLGVDNIHVMRESLFKVAEALRDADAMASLPGYEVMGGDREVGSFLDRQALRKSGWLRHISAILDGTLIIVRNVHINSSHVLIHCSDGWDRTAQLSSLSQICLDPFYRTIKGFQILVEKDWLSFGHKFADRCGHMSSEKFFLVSTGDGVVTGGGGGADAAQAFFASVQNKFTHQSHLKETSPVFHQYLECVRQLQRQFPKRFEFNERFLERLHYHLYSCQFGTFLFNCERERRVPESGNQPAVQRTKSVWDLLNSSAERSKYLNSEYDTSLDDRDSRRPTGDMGVLLPDPKDVRFWHELYGRTDEEMNGRMVISQAVGVEVIGPIEGEEDDPINHSSVQASAMPLPPSPSPSPGPLNERPIPSRSQTSISSLSPASQDAQSRSQSSERRLSAQRQDSFKPFGTTSSTFSLHSSANDNQREVPTWTPPKVENKSPVLPRKWVGDGMAGGGMKSMWASLSSNATAALSVVQGAVDGVTKDLRGTSIGGRPQGGGELVEKPLPSSRANQHWTVDDGSTSAWRSAESSSASYVDVGNPWTSSHSTIKSVTHDQMQTPPATCPRSNSTFTLIPINRA